MPVLLPNNHHTLHAVEPPVRLGEHVHELMPDEIPERRGRGPRNIACGRCRRRKQRCDNARPKCQTCTGVGADCVYPPASDDKRLYIRQLEEKIRNLEKIVNGRDAGQASRQSDGTRTSFHVSSVRSKSPEARPTPAEAPVSAPRDDLVLNGSSEVEDAVNANDDDGILSNGITVETAIFSSESMTAPAEGQSRALTRLFPVMDSQSHNVDSNGDINSGPFIDESSMEMDPTSASRVDLPLNPALSSPIDTTLQTSLTAQPPPSAAQLISRLPLAQLLPSPDVARNLQNGHRANETAPHLQYDIQTREEDAKVMPEKQERAMLVTQFLEYYNAAFNVFHEDELSNLGKVDPPDLETRLDAFIAFMVFAIASASMTRGPLPHFERRSRELLLWRQAQRHLQAALTVTGLRRLQAYHLLLHYVFLRPENGSVWLIAGDVIRTAVDLGLHYERSTITMTLSPRELDARRRLFWATFCVDTNISIVLGRPPGIPWEWVSAELPSLSSNPEQDPMVAMTMTVDPKRTSLHHLIRLRLLQSEINRYLYSETAIGKGVDLDWLESMQNRLEEWRTASPQPTHPLALMNTDWFQVNYHISVALLNRPCPANEKPNSTCLNRATKASSAIMQMFKRMHRSGRISLVWLAINHLFMSGITFLSCLLMHPNRKDLPPIATTMMDIQACASTLEALTSIQPGGHAICDAFEHVSTAVINALSDYSTQTAPSASAGPLATPVSAPGIDPSNDFTIYPGESNPGEAWQALQSILFRTSDDLEPMNTFNAIVPSFEDILRSGMDSTV